MSAEGERAPAQDVESLFLLSGGRISRGMQRLRLARGDRLHAWRLAGLLAAVTLLLAAPASGRIAAENGGMPYFGHVFPVQAAHGTRGAVGEYHAGRSGGRSHEG